MFLNIYEIMLRIGISL